MFFALTRSFWGSWLGRNPPSDNEMFWVVWDGWEWGHRDWECSLKLERSCRQVGRRKVRVGCTRNIFPAYILWEVERSTSSHMHCITQLLGFCRTRSNPGVLLVDLENGQLQRSLGGRGPMKRKI